MVQAFLIKYLCCLTRIIFEAVFEIVRKLLKAPHISAQKENSHIDKEDAKIKIELFMYCNCHISYILFISTTQTMNCEAKPMVPTTDDELYEFIKQCHNPDLVDPKESPNGNYIIHIYNDGEITEQKGGWAYGQRSERTMVYELSHTYDPTKFPISSPSNFGKIIGYAIVTQVHAYEIRKYMQELRKTK